MTGLIDLKGLIGEITEKRPSGLSAWNTSTYRQPSPKVTMTQEVLAMFGRCRYLKCRAWFEPPKPNYYFCCWEHCQAHYANNDYRGYQRTRDQSYDRGYWDGARAAPATSMPAHIWKAMAVLAHPDRWGDAPEGVRQLSHEAMVWLNTHRPVERN